MLQQHSWLLLPLLLLVLLQMTSAIKFDLMATADEVPPKCISQYVSTDTFVAVTVTVGIGYNQQVDIEISDNSPSHNEYGKRKDVSGETRLTFITHADADVAICFKNILANGFNPDPKYHRVIDLDVDVGAEAIDYNALAKEEKLAPLEAELRKLEQVVQEIVDEMEYLRKREARMRDTNESTNDRVKWFSLCSMVILISLGCWQIYYLKKFFQRKRLID